MKTRLDDHLERTLLARGFDTVETNTTLMSIFVTMLPILIVALVVYFVLIRPLKMAGKGANRRDE